jgi:hypothetical protein
MTDGRWGSRFKIQDSKFKIEDSKIQDQDRMTDRELTHQPFQLPFARPHARGLTCH